MKEFIEKLNAGLEEELKTAREMQTTQCIGHNGYGTPLQSKLGGEICALLKVQNIVNQLAEEHNNDFCEWRKQGGYNFYLHKTSCGTEDIFDDSYKYCPYCGKQIKITPY